MLTQQYPAETAIAAAFDHFAMLAGWLADPAAAWMSPSVTLRAVHCTTAAAPAAAAKVLAAATRVGRRCEHYSFRQPPQGGRVPLLLLPLLLLLSCR